MMKIKITKNNSITVLVNVKETKILLNLYQSVLKDESFQSWIETHSGLQ